MKACSPPTSPTDAYTPILVAESFGSYGTNSSKQNSEESITITSKREKDNNGAAKYIQKKILMEKTNVYCRMRVITVLISSHWLRKEDRNGDSHDVLAINTQTGSVNEVNL